MFKKFAFEVSANGVQVILNQLFNLLVFYFTSRYLPKEDFGKLSLSVAIAGTIIAILSFGMDQVVVAAVAKGDVSNKTSGIYFFHALLCSIFIGLLAFLFFFFTKFFFDSYKYVFLIVLSYCITFLAMPFKLWANGKQKFKTFALISIPANFTKILLLFFLYLFYEITLDKIAVIFLVSSLVELIVSYFATSVFLRTNILPHWDAKRYLHLIKISLPQLGVVIFDSALARIDWILLGFMVGSLATADYSFTYKAFEISKLPLLIIGPVLLPRFVHLFNDKKNLTEEGKGNLDKFFILEMVIAILIPLVLITLWEPVVTALTNGKYSNTKPIFLVLAFSIPLLYINNFLWTMAFVQQQLKTIFLITLITSVINISLNLLLIPRFGSYGAAIAFTLSSIVQLALYKRKTLSTKYQLSLKPFILCLLIAVLDILLLKVLNLHIILETIICITVYIVAVWAFVLPKRFLAII